MSLSHRYALALFDGDFAWFAGRRMRAALLSRLFSETVALDGLLDLDGLVEDEDRVRPGPGSRWASRSEPTALYFDPDEEALTALGMKGVTFCGVRPGVEIVGALIYDADSRRVVAQITTGSIIANGGDVVLAGSGRSEANDPKLLRAELAKLRAELNKGRTTDAGAIRTAIIEAEHEARRRARVGVANELEPRLTEAQRALGALRDAVGSLDREPLAAAVAAVERATGRTPNAVVTSKEQARRAGWKAIKQTGIAIQTAAAEARLNGYSLGKGEKAILSAVAMRRGPARRETLTVLTGYKRSSRDTYLQRLRAAGLLEEAGGGRVMLTAVGAATVDAEPMPTGNELREFWLRRLPAGEGKVLRVLIEAHPRAVLRDELTNATGYKRSSRDTYLQRLAARELVEFQEGAPRAAADLFEGEA